MRDFSALSRKQTDRVVAWGLETMMLAHAIDRPDGTRDTRAARELQAIVRVLKKARLLDEAELRREIIKRTIRRACQILNDGT